MQSMQELPVLRNIDIFHFLDLLTNFIHGKQILCLAHLLFYIIFRKNIHESKFHLITAAKPESSLFLRFNDDRT